MSKKYVIEIKPEYEDTTKGVMVLGAKDSNLFVDTLAVEDLEELNSDYINEHFGELQDEAYQRGFEDGKKSVSDPDRIEVGDEVIWKTDNITLIATSIYKVGSINWCDGVAKDGKVYSTLIEKDRKTGKHYDIASILEAMRNTH